MPLVTDSIYRLALGWIAAEKAGIYREKRRLVTEANRYVPPPSAD